MRRAELEQLLNELAAAFSSSWHLTKDPTVFILARIHQFGGIKKYSEQLKSSEPKITPLLDRLAPVEARAITILKERLGFHSRLAQNNYEKLEEAGFLSEFHNYLSDFSGQIVSVSRYGQHIVVECLRTIDGQEKTIYYGTDTCLMWESWEKALLSQMFDDLVLPAVLRLLPKE